MALARELYGARSQAYMVSLCGEDFDHGERLSRVVAEALPSLVVAAESLIGRAAQEPASTTPAAYLAMRLAWRDRPALSAEGPVPVGGLRISCSSSFSTTALLCSWSLEANRSVSFFGRFARR
jgi:hypothetical protein